MSKTRIAVGDFLQKSKEVTDKDAIRRLTTTVESTVAEFLAGLEETFAEVGDAAQAERRRAVAAQHDWGRVLESMSRLILGT
jgi:hypothetical protein